MLKLKWAKLVQLACRPAQMRPNLGGGFPASAGVRGAFARGGKMLTDQSASLQRRRWPSQQIPNLVSNPPPTQITVAAGWNYWGRVSAISIGDLAMVPAQPQHKIQERHNGSPCGRDDDTFDEFTDDDVVSLLEENARLRKLVVRLSEIVLRNVADGK